MGGRKVMREVHPPTWAIKFFRWFCNDHLAEAVLGDMLELYQRRITLLGKRKADILFVCNVLQFIQPFALQRRSQYIQTNHITMFRNYFTITWRVMTRQKMYTGIKIGGFALGLATCIIIALFIRNELNYDQYYKDKARIFRIYGEYFGPETEKGTDFPAPIAQILKSDFPEVETAARLIPNNWFDAGSNLIRRDDQEENTYEEGFVYVDPELLSILEIQMAYGSQARALAQPNSMVLSKRIADKYFPGEDPTGKIMILNDNKSTPYVVGGVMQNFPATSHLQYDFLLTLANKEFWPGEQTNWCCWNYNAYIKIRPDADPVALEKKLVHIRDAYFVDYLVKTGNQEIENVKKNYFFRLQPVTDIHLWSEGIDDAVVRGDIRYVWLFGGIACFILLLACINFVNLTTARSANRAKEVGLRKVVGSLRKHLVRQFMTESLVFSFVSFVFAMALVVVMLPYFNILAAKTLTIPWMTGWFAPTLFASAVIIGILAGAYPSLYLSAFRPVEVLKGGVSRGSKNSKMRSAMVIFQFTTSIVLIIGTLVIYRQMNYILNTKIGYDKEQVILVHGANTLDNQQAFKDELRKLSFVRGVTVSDYLPVKSMRDHNLFWRDGKSQEEKGIGAQKWYVDEDYLSTMGMKLVEGRNFNPEIASDSQAIIINQTMATAFNFKNPVGEKIMNWETYNVIGVVDDFNFESMKGAITPLCLVLGHGGSIVSVKLSPGNINAATQTITDVWNKFMPHQPIRYSFLDDNYAQMYEDVQRMGYIFGSFAFLAIVVACLGLFALSAFMVEQRSKEITIRRVLGASLDSIFRLLTKNFVALVLISFVVAAPLGWYMMQKWLEDYSYRVEITWDIFALSGVLSIVIALLTVSYQSLHAAMANPADNLRNE